MAEKLTDRQFAERLGELFDDAPAADEIAALYADGCPCTGKGKARRASWPDAGRWYVRHRIDREVTYRAGTIPSSTGQGGLAALLGLDVRQVRNLQKEKRVPFTREIGANGIPGPPTFPLPDAVHAYIEFKTKGEKTATAVDYKRAQAEKMLVDAERGKLDLAERRKELVSRAFLREQVAELFAQVRAGMLSLPGRWAPKLVGILDSMEMRTQLKRAIETDGLPELRAGVLRIAQAIPAEDDAAGGVDQALVRAIAGADDERDAADDVDDLDDVDVVEAGDG